ncbi:putative uncharacterized protein [Clostridium sp. CAG:571]|nr:putative uncharacterized protein [Clostridium sp. CAG:571]HJJ07528.1 HAD-IA family hydrolase [Clostridiaceae bacterium]
MENNKIYKIIDKYDVISFDIFDTLIKRVVNSPKQIFDIVEKKYNETYSKKISSFKMKRIASENEIKDHIATLTDIYDNMKKYYSKDECDSLKEIEILTEVEYCISNSNMKEIYDYCKRKNKKIYAVSDMYLSSDILKRILKNNSYEIENIIVSCEYNCNKNSSELFKFIPEYGKNKILHIGDSLRADYIGAKKAGIGAFKIKKNIVENNNDNYEAILSLRNNNKYFYSLGYSILGPVLLEFAKWLKIKFKNENVNDIYFFAREGKIYKSVFDILYNERFNTNYLYISRRAITMSNFKYMKFDDLNSILKYFTIKKNSTLGDTIKYLNLSLDLNEIDINQNVYSFLKNDDLYNKINYALKLESNKVNEITLEYLKQEKVEKKFSIVDIGWNGTMQKCLITFLDNNNINFELNGHYFLMLKELEKSHSFIKLNTTFSYSIMDNPLLIENLFQCVDGSTIGYRKNNNIVEPIKKEIEFDDYSKEAINDIDKGIIDFILNWKEYGFVLDEEKFKTDSLNRFMDFIDNPNRIDVNEFSKFCYSDIKNDCKLISSDLNIKKGLYNSGWKYGYLKSKLKVKLNYKFIIKVLKKIGGDKL